MFDVVRSLLHGAWACLPMYFMKLNGDVSVTLDWLYDHPSPLDGESLKDMVRPFPLQISCLYKIGHRSAIDPPSRNVVGVYKRLHSRQVRDPPQKLPSLGRDLAGNRGRLRRGSRLIDSVR